MTVPNLLRDALAAKSIAFGNGRKPADASTRYIVAWFDAGAVKDRSLRSRDGFSQVGTFHCYGQTVEAAQFAYDALTAAVIALNGATVNGRRLMMPEQLTTLPVQRDDALNPPLFDFVCEWRFGDTPV